MGVQYTRLLVCSLTPILTHTQFLLLSYCKQQKWVAVRLLYVKIVPCPDLTSMWAGYETSNNYVMEGYIVEQ